MSDWVGLLAGKQHALPRSDNRQALRRTMQGNKTATGKPENDPAA